MGFCSMRRYGVPTQTRAQLAPQSGGGMSIEIGGKGEGCINRGGGGEVYSDL